MQTCEDLLCESWNLTQGYGAPEFGGNQLVEIPNAKGVKNQSSDGYNSSSKQWTISSTIFVVAPSWAINTDEERSYFTQCTDSNSGLFSDLSRMFWGFYLFVCLILYWLLFFLLLPAIWNSLVHYELRHARVIWDFLSVNQVSAQFLGCSIFQTLQVNCHLSVFSNIQLFFILSPCGFISFEKKILWLYC